MDTILSATHFAAQKHKDQRRKDIDKTPYINHPIEVANLLSEVAKIRDEDTLIAALLHDTVEDTDTTFAEIEQHFGAEIASLVKECTDDKSLPKAERKRLQIVNAPHKSNRAKLIKMADKICNLSDLLRRMPYNWDRRRCYEYFIWASQVIEGLRGQNTELEHMATEALEKGLQIYKT